MAQVSGQSCGQTARTIEVVMNLSIPVNSIVLQTVSEMKEI
jgi:hypothetical protein